MILWRNIACGFEPQTCLLYPRVLIIYVVVFFFIALTYPLCILGMMTGGRFLLCKFLFPDKIFRVACVYAPNRSPARDDLDEVGDRIDPSVPTLLCGDFNTVDSGLDRTGSDPLDTSRDGSVALSHLLDGCCVVDAWRFLHPGIRAFTWSRPNGAFPLGIDLVGLLVLDLLPWFPVILFPAPFWTIVRSLYPKVFWMC